jgi:hypothetical protein
VRGTISARRKTGQASLHEMLRAATVARHHGRMRSLLMSNDPVRLSFLVSLLADAGIEAIVLDHHTSAVEGSIGAIPRRLAVAEESYDRARRILREAGEA